MSSPARLGPRMRALLNVPLLSATALPTTSGRRPVQRQQPVEYAGQQRVRGGGGGRAEVEPAPTGQRRVRRQSLPQRCHEHGSGRASGSVGSSSASRRQASAASDSGRRTSVS